MMLEERCPVATRGLILAAAGFFSFELYTFTDAMSTHLFPSQLALGFPAPYDIYSVGMIAMLAALMLIGSLRTLCLAPASMAWGAALMAISPLYAVMDSTFPAYFLAILGGVGKAVVFIHVGRMLSLVGARRLLFIVAGSIVLSKGLCLLTAMNGAAFAVSGCACALVCAFSTMCATQLLSRREGESCGGGDEPLVPGLGFKGIGGNRESTFLSMDSGQFTGFLIAVAVFAAACIVCVNPAETKLFEQGSLFYGAAGACRFVAAAGAGVVVVIMLQFRSGLLMAGRLTAFAMLFGAAGMLVPQVPETGAYVAALFAQAMFITLFWVTVPLIKCEHRSFTTRRLSEFEFSAFAYCLGISFTAALSRMGFERSDLVLPFAALLLLCILFVMPDRALATTDVLAYRSKKEGHDEAVLRVAREYGLSERETEVFELLARGYGSKAIQEKLSISSSTVSTHVQRIYRKTGLHSKQDVIKEVELRHEQEEENR